MEPVVRFLRRVEVDPDLLCWLWTGPGRFFYVDESNTVTVRRFSFEFWRGPIPQRHEVLPRCGAVACVNPDHLTVGDKAARELMRATALSAVRPRPRWGGRMASGWMGSGYDPPSGATTEAPRRYLDRSELRCAEGHWVLARDAITKTEPNGEVTRRCKTCRAEQDAELLARPFEETSPGDAFRARLDARRERYQLDRRRLGVAS